MMIQAVKRLSRYDIIMKRASDTTFEMTEDFLCQGCCHYIYANFANLLH